MREMEQNEFYDESEFEEGADLDTEAEEDTSTTITRLWGVPIKVVIPVAVIILIVLIGIVVIALKKNGGGSNADIVLPEYNSSNVTTTVSSTSCYVNSAYVGYINGPVTEGSTIFKADGTIYGNLLSSGTTAVTDAFGATLGYTNVATEPVQGVTSESTQTSGSFDTETVSLLRKYGYTGDEIELALSTGASVDEMVATAQALQDEVAKEALARMSDSASEEFQLLVNTTQYCMPYQEYIPTSWTDEGYTDKQGSYIVNADYEKIPTYGYQLRIKVKIANGTYAFMDVAPTRYSSMPETGNIVVQVNYNLYGPSVEQLQFYITSIVEKDITTLTVNPEDSAVDLTDVIN